MASSTSFRLSDEAKQRLTSQAERHGVSVTALLERLILEGADSIDHPGIIHRGPLHDRRAALAAGPDVWEVIARLRELDGAEEQRVAVLCEESQLHPRQVRLAIDFAVQNSDDIDRRIEAHEQAIQESAQAAEKRAAYLA